MGDRIMSKMKKIIPLILYILILLLIIPSVNPNLTFASTEQVIYVELSQFKFEPSRIVVNKGDTIVFKLKSSDVAHGFYIDGYDVNLVVTPGELVTVTIVANQIGKFKIRCSVTCGPLHPFMVGDFIVTENGTNLPFILSLILLFLTGFIPFLPVKGGEKFE